MTPLNTLQSISIIVASFVASAAVIYGINTWRREYIGKRRLQLAEEVLALFYEARDAITSIRNPFSYTGEAPSRASPDNEPPEEKRMNDQVYLFFSRYNQHRDLFGKINSMRYRYMAQFGKHSAKPFTNLDSILKDMFISANMLTYYWKRQGRRDWKNQEEFQRHLDEMHKHEAVFWQMSPDNDSITPRLESVISDIEAQSSRIIRKSK